MYEYTVGAGLTTMEAVFDNESCWGWKISNSDGDDGKAVTRATSLATVPTKSMVQLKSHHRYGPQDKRQKKIRTKFIADYVCTR